MKGDSKATIAALKEMYQNGPWCLSAISPEKKGMETRTFWPDDPVPDVEYDTSESGCLAWLEKWNGTWNLYFHVNPVMHLLTKKAERRDIKQIVCLHVDIDAKSQHLPLEQQLDQIYKKLTETPPRGLPPPTVIIFSGGGFQAFWFLKEPIEINGDVARAEELKRYNQQLEILFDGDNCHNVDRLMRAPFTINIPDKKKAERGRKPALAKVVFMDMTRRYDIKQFVQAPATQVDKDVDVAGRQVVVDISDNVKRLDSVDDLEEWNVPNRVRVIVLQGHHPDEPKEGDNSRSAWLFDAVCNLMRCGVPEATVYSIITDPKFGIAESVLELKGQARRYAIKQIISAKEWIEEPWLANLNNQYCVVADVGGKVKVAEEKPSKTMPGVMEWQFISPEEFAKRYENIQVEVGTNAKGHPIKKELGLWWRKHEKRRQVARMVFQPDVIEVKDAINLWKGFTVQAVPGDKHLSYKEHIRRNICRGNEVHFEYLWKWLANVVQNPAEPGQVAVVLKGQRGAGKGFFVNQFGKLFGRHYKQVANPKHIVGNFNSHLRDCCLLFADEAVFVGDRSTQSVLKTLITEPTLAIESKGVDIEMFPNYIHLIMASNDEHVIRAGTDERRFFMLDVSSEVMQNTDYFDGIKKDMDAGGRENLLHDLLTTDLTGFNVWSVPKTEALREQIDLSLDPMDAWWLQKLMDGAVLGDSWDRTVPRDDLSADFMKFLDTYYRGVYREWNPTKIGIQFRHRLPSLGEARMTMERKFTSHDGFEVTKKERVYCHLLPSLQECREFWDKKNQRKTVWPELSV